MYDNTFLGMKASDHHRRQKEAEAAQWDEAQQTLQTRATDTIKRGYRKLIFMMIVLVMAVLIITLAPSKAISAQDEPGAAHTSSDAMPSVNLLE